MADILAATHNAHKALELATMLRAAGHVVHTLAEHPQLPEPSEDGDTFEANALHKARTIHRLTGGVVLADDSGLEVTALGGAPGVHSKRFSPEGTAEGNNALLLVRLTGVADRTARFRCVLAVVTDTFEGTVDGTCRGHIADVGRGGHGFGYDPLFVPDGEGGRTMAELTPDEKNRISHRGRALARLPELLAQASIDPPAGTDR